MMLARRCYSNDFVCVWLWKWKKGLAVGSLRRSNDLHIWRSVSTWDNQTIFLTISCGFQQSNSVFDNQRRFFDIPLTGCREKLLFADQWWCRLCADKLRSGTWTSKTSRELPHYCLKIQWQLNRWSGYLLAPKTYDLWKPSIHPSQKDRKTERQKDRKTEREIVGMTKRVQSTTTQLSQSPVTLPDHWTRWWDGSTKTKMNVETIWLWL